MTKVRRLGALVVVAGLLALSSLPGPNVLGQGKAVGPQPAPKPGKAQPKAFTDDVTIPINRESRRLIQAAQDYIKQKDWRVAAECLQSLLEAKEDSFIEMESQDDKGTAQKQRISVRLEANRLIGELPPEGLEFYQVQYGPAADNLLKEALEKNDAHILADVALRYRHTRAGARATSLLGTYHLDRGNYLMAALSFERLLNRPDADKLPFGILFNAALACRRAGEKDLSEKLWGKVADKAARGDVIVGRQKVTVQQLRQEFERSAGLPTQFGQHDWPLFHGNPARNAEGVGSTAFLEPRWQWTMLPLDETYPIPPLDPDVLRATLYLRNELLPAAFNRLEGKPVLPTFFPVAAGGKVIFRTYDGVYAYSLKDSVTADGPVKAGELAWAAPGPSGLHGMVVGDRRMTFDSWYKDSNNGIPGYAALGPAGVLFENSVIGTLSHDGQRVYFVDDLAVPPHPNLMRTNANLNGRTSFGPFEKEVQGNRLVCVELESGLLKWSINDRKVTLPRETGEHKESTNAGLELTDTFFLGPPLPLGGKIYILAEKNTELRLICLDPVKVFTYLVGGDHYSAPEIVWQQTLGTANYRLPQDSMRRLQAAHLAYGNGILICPTNAGLILGVDLLSHSLVWAHSYRDGNGQGMDDNLMFRGGRGFRVAPIGVVPSYVSNQERWRPTAPVIQGDKVVFTAHDSSAVHCLNLRDGRLLWHTPRKDDDLYFAGVFGSRVVVVGKGSIRALGLDDGKELWSQPTGSLPSGQGTASDDVYYLPLQGIGEKKEPGILAINLATGTPVAPPARSRKKDAIGNLVFVNGELISQTALTVSVFPELKRMLAEIDSRLKANPNDPIGLTERGELYLDKGELSSAVADLHSALKFAPPAPTRAKARTKLHEALTDLFKNDFNAAEKYLDEYRELCNVDVPADADAGAKVKLADEQLRREANYLSLLGRGREKQGRLLDALAAYEQFGALTGSKELVSSIDEKYTRARPDVWSRGRIKGMYDQAPPDQRKLLEAAIGQRWDAVHDRGDVEAVRRFVAVFGTAFPVGREAQLTLAEKLLATGNPDDLSEAETKLQALYFPPDLRRQDPTIAAKAIDALIRVYVRRGLYEDAVGLYKQLGTEFGDVVVHDGKTGAELLNELYTDKRFLPYLEPHGLAWQGTLRAQEVHAQFPMTSSTLSIMPEGELLPFFDRYRLVLDMNMQGGNTWHFRLLDRTTNEQRWTSPNLPAAQYFIFGNGQQFMNFNNFNNNVNIAFLAANAGQPGGLPLNHHFAFAKGHTFVAQLNTKIYAYNLTDGKEVWQYDLYSQGAAQNGNPNVTLDPDGRITFLYNDGRQEKVGGIGVVESNYVCLQGRVSDEGSGRREGLIALDPNRSGPSILWTKTDVPLRAQIFGDDQHVYIVEPGDDHTPTTVRALRAQDGVSVPVPDFGPLYTRRVRTVGRCLLLQEDDPQGGKVLRLYDVETGRDVWRSSFSAGALVIRSEDPALTGVVEKDQTVTFIETRTGHVLFKSMIQAEHVRKLQSVALVTDRDRYYLALSEKPENGLSWSPGAGGGLRSLLVNGPLYAFNRLTGKLEWVCDFLQHQALLLEQVQDLPLLLFTSSYFHAGVNRQQTMRVSGVDKRTGKLLYDKEMPPTSPFMALRADPQAGVIDLVHPEFKVTFRADPNQAAQASPPRPPTR